MLGTQSSLFIRAKPLDVCLQAFVLYFVYAPDSWPESLVVRSLLVALPLLLWSGLHLAVWLYMVRVLKRFR